MNTTGRSVYDSALFAMQCKITRPSFLHSLCGRTLMLLAVACTNATRSRVPKTWREMDYFLCASTAQGMY